MTLRNRLLLDGLMLGAFVAAYRPSWTGFSIHEWLSLALVVPTLVHLVVNWDWVVRTIRRFCSKLRVTARLNLVVDVALFLSVVTVMLSGLLVSEAVMGLFGVAGAKEGIWYRVHSVSADAAILTVAAHVMLHLKWMVRAARRRVLRGPGAGSGAAAMRPALSPVRVRVPRGAGDAHDPAGRRYR
ncbi:MAG: DUF4405 domain-containing protein [Gaiellales bacterium]|nr:DUF4405 domain-containing protein [Gaiellales bacterium]